MTIDTSIGVWLLVTESETDEECKAEFERAFGRQPEHIVPEGPWRFVGPVSKDEENERKAR